MTEERASVPPLFVEKAAREGAGGKIAGRCQVHPHPRKFRTRGDRGREYFSPSRKALRWLGGCTPSELIGWAVLIASFGFVFV